ncbi:MAG: phosphatidylcholine synthase [Herpetosiphonaceae bacterium]|nr:MAG: phosphatidylcholine synthase [Herpetosiphonaceae bacterium]
MLFRKTLAWCVHGYTALGLLAAAGMAVLIVYGGDRNFRAAFALMLIATAIDASDGWLARRVQVKELTPSFDGRRLDDLIDFQTYTSLPLLLIWRSNMLPEDWSWLLLVPLLASAYGFSQAEAKTADNFFLGFPSYWNVVAFYLYYLQPVAWISLLIILSLAALTFVPLKYLYPSQKGPYALLTNVLGIAWAILVVVILLYRPVEVRTLVLLSLFYPIYYLIVSWMVSLRTR